MEHVKHVLNSPELPILEGIVLQTNVMKERGFWQMDSANCVLHILIRIQMIIRTVLISSVSQIKEYLMMQSAMIVLNILGLKIQVNNVHLMLVTIDRNY